MNSTRKSVLVKITVCLSIILLAVAAFVSFYNFFKTIELEYPAVYVFYRKSPP